MTALAEVGDAGIVGKDIGRLVLGRRACQRAIPEPGIRSPLGVQKKFDRRRFLGWPGAERAPGVLAHDKDGDRRVTSGRRTALEVLIKPRKLKIVDDRGS